MKRGREDEEGSTSSSTIDSSMNYNTAFSPVHPSAHHLAHHSAATATSISPWKQQHSLGGSTFLRTKGAPLKRFRDRSVPIDAMSRMMSAAVTNARMKKVSAQMQAIALLGVPPPANLSASCAVCDSGRRHASTPAAVNSCTYCDKRVGACCRRECESCLDHFCSLCTTLNCDQQFDRTLCWSCNDVQMSS